MIDSRRREERRAGRAGARGRAAAGGRRGKSGADVAKNAARCSEALGLRAENPRVGGRVHGLSEVEACRRGQQRVAGGTVASL